MRKPSEHELSSHIIPSKFRILPQFILPWKSSDKPLLVLSEKWLVATDNALQWITYHWDGLRWRAATFHAMRDTLLRDLGNGFDHSAIATIKAWPAYHREWLKQQSDALEATP